MDHPVVVPHDPAWRGRFLAEREGLRAALAPWLVADVEHVGSTATPGASAKPVIDMIAGVGDLVAARDAVAALEAIDYGYRPHRPDAHLFDKPRGAAWAQHTHHLHLTEPGSAPWNERLAFRDALREDPALVAEHDARKHAHIAEAGAPGAYRESKCPFVARVLRSRGLVLATDARRLTPPDGRSVGP